MEAALIQRILDRHFRLCNSFHSALEKTTSLNTCQRSRTKETKCPTPWEVDEPPRGGMTKAQEQRLQNIKMVEMGADACVAVLMCFLSQ